MKLNEQKLTIQTEQKELELTKEFQAKEMRLQTEYFDKVMAKVEEARKEMKEVYVEIMRRLPNVTMSIKEQR